MDERPILQPSLPASNIDRLAGYVRRLRTGLAALALILSACIPTAAAAAGYLQIYSDSLATGWFDYSWKTTRNLANPSPAHGGQKSLAVTITGGWGALYLHTDTEIETTGADQLRFWVHGGSQGGQELKIVANGDGDHGVDIAIAPGVWTEVVIPLSDLGSPASLYDLYWQDTTGGTQATFYLDDIALLRFPTSNPVIYADSLSDGWTDRSWKTTRDLANASPAHGGAKSIAVTIDGGSGALYLHGDTPMDTFGYDQLRFWIHGGSKGNQRLKVIANEDGQHSVEITAQADTWTEAIVPLASLGSPATLSALYWQDNTGSPLATFYLDDISLVRLPRSNLPIYANSLAGGWLDYSWKTTRNMANTVPAHGAPNSLAVTIDGGWAALYLHRDTPIDTVGYSQLRFWVHGGSQGGQQLTVIANEDSRYGYEFTAQANTWTPVIIPLSALGNPTSLSDLYWQDTTGSAQQTFYLDDIALISFSPSDCVFNWAEQAFPYWFSPSGGTPGIYGPYYYRHYSGTDNYLAASSEDDHAWVLGPISGGRLLDVGPMSSFISQAGCLD